MRIHKIITLDLIAMLSLVPCSIAYADSSSQNVDVDFEHGDSIELSMSTNKVTFGNISGLLESTATTPKDLIATVRSSSVYDLYMKATDDFKNSEGDSIDVSNLSIGINSNYREVDAVNSNLTLVSNAQKTSKLANGKSSYSINFKLKDIVGQDKGKFVVPLTATAMQK